MYSEKEKEMFKLLGLSDLLNLEPAVLYSS